MPLSQLYWTNMRKQSNKEFSGIAVHVENYDGLFAGNIYFVYTEQEAEQAASETSQPQTAYEFGTDNQIGKVFYVTGIAAHTEHAYESPAEASEEAAALGQQLANKENLEFLGEISIENVKNAE